MTNYSTKINQSLSKQESDVIKGYIRIPIAQIMANQRFRSGSCQTLHPESNQIKQKMQNLFLMIVRISERLNSAFDNLY